MKTITIATATAALISLTSSFNALAGNGHAYNGSYCNPYYGTQSDSFEHRQNGIKNTSSSTKYISCPVIVDEIANTTGTHQTTLHYTGPGTVSCIMFNQHGIGSTRQTQSGTRAGTGWFTIPGFTSDVWGGTYSMYCSLPSGGTLNTIWVNEKN